MENTNKSESLYLKSIDYSVTYKRQGKPNDSNETKSKDKSNLKASNDLLNANPEIFEDRLPQPYRFINKVLQNDILKEVYSSVFEIEKNKKDPNYEGGLLEISPHGVFQTDGISFICNKSDPLEKIWIGNKEGHISLFDPFHKEIIMSFCISKGKRVINASISITPILEFNVCTVAGICRDFNNIKIIRYKSGDNTFTHCFTIQRELKGPENLPWKCRLSNDSRFLCLITFSGNLEIFSIPQIEKVIIENPNLKKMEDQQMPSTQIKYSLIFDSEVKELKQPILEIPCRLPIKVPNKEDILNGIFSHSIDHQLEKKEEEVPEQKSKSNKVGKLPQEEEIQKPKDETEYIQNKKIIVPEYILDGGFDFSLDIHPPDCYPEIGFIYDNIRNIQKEQVFSNNRKMAITTKILIFWKMNNIFESIDLAESNQQLPWYFLMSKPINEEKLKESLFNKECIKYNPIKNSSPNFQYKITCIEMSLSSLIFAVGLSDGTIEIWDSKTEFQLALLDKHKKYIKCLKFLGDEFLVSGSYDGSIHIYELKKFTLLMKRENIYRSKENIQIMNIEISEKGLPLVLDFQNNLRLYDVFHAQKIVKLIGNEYNESLRYFQSQYFIGDKFIVIPAENSTKNSECHNLKSDLLIFRIHELLTKVFPKLNLLEHDSYDKDALFNYFAKEKYENLFKIDQLSSINNSIIEKFETSSNANKSSRSKSKSQSKSQSKLIGSNISQSNKAGLPQKLEIFDKRTLYTIAGTDHNLQTINKCRARIPEKKKRQDRVSEKLIEIDSKLQAEDEIIRITQLQKLRKINK